MARLPRPVRATVTHAIDDVTKRISRFMSRTTETEPPLTIAISASASGSGKRWRWSRAPSNWPTRAIAPDLDSFLAVLGAQRTLRDAEDQLAAVETRVAVSVVALVKAVGGGGP